MENDEPVNKRRQSSPWFWIFLIVLVVVTSQCTQHGYEVQAQKKAEEKAWQDSPEYAFRFCITTAAGANGTATAEQIAACNKAAGR